jgi:hypothetical protein
MEITKPHRFLSFKKQVWVDFLILQKYHGLRDTAILILQHLVLAKHIKVVYRGISENFNILEIFKNNSLPNRAVVFSHVHLPVHMFIRKIFMGRNYNLFFRWKLRSFFRWAA